MRKWCPVPDFKAAAKQKYPMDQGLLEFAAFLENMKGPNYSFIVYPPDDFSNALRVICKIQVSATHNENAESILRITMDADGGYDIVRHHKQRKFVAAKGVAADDVRPHIEKWIKALEGSYAFSCQRDLNRVPAP
ncbi:hypothetical protein [Micavibrio aeruginosavorus]|uniref:hypothetical protein n=1 Tax=Micavibrio aeruginosavorus TaxID=349221 RepID=UPI003F4AE7EA